MTSQSIKTNITGFRYSSDRGTCEAWVDFTAPGLSARVQMTWSSMTDTCWDGGTGPIPSANVTVDGTLYWVRRDGDLVTVTRGGSAAPGEVSARVVEAFWAADAAFTRAALGTPWALDWARRYAAQAKEKADRAAADWRVLAGMVEAMEKVQEATV